jgi:hypothetical protein
VGLQLVDGPRSVAHAGAAILRFFDAVGMEPEYVSYRNPFTKTRRFRRKNFVKLIGDPMVPEITVWTPGNDGAGVSCFLRLVPDPKVPGLEEFTRRWFHVAVPTHPPLFAGAVRALVEEIEELCDVVVGCAAAFPSGWAATHECALGQSPPDGTDPDIRERLSWDRRMASPKKRSLRRLYPVNIIGPEVWAKLPPLPAFDPMPQVEDFGRCKLLTAWPTLCAPRDPAFLRGTRALREWLWPYTMQNPADHVDNDPPPDVAPST